VNVASPAYHRLHTDQLTVMGMIAPVTALQVAAERFRSYEANPLCRARALAAKAAFRVAVPR
jgi:hypothetical protein